MDRRLLELDLKTSLSSIADLAMPRVCIVCGRALLPDEKHLCIPCLADLPETHFSCSRINPMADSFNARVIPSDSDTADCNEHTDTANGSGRQGLDRHSHPRVGGGARDSGRGLERPCFRDEAVANSFEPYNYATALFYYRSGAGYSRITQALKYGRDFAAGRFFAGMLAERIKASALYADVDLIVPVPLHWTRQWKRGYNQAAIIAAEVSRILGVPCDSHFLKRTKRTTSQAHTGLQGKEKNVSGAFRARRKECPYRHLLLLDDVYTTGATLTACHNAIREAFGPAVRISIAALAFVDRQQF